MNLNQKSEALKRKIGDNKSIRSYFYPLFNAENSLANNIITKLIIFILKGRAQR